MKKKRPIQIPKRQKVIPRHFTKKRKATLSEILRAASNSRRIKELLQNNRALAAALEESQCIAANNNILLQSYTRDSNQVLMARNKLKEMASTIQKLVGDLDAVLGCLDMNYLTSSTRFCNDVLKLRICAPDLETIEESPRSSVAGNEDELMEDASPMISQLSHLEMEERSTPVFDTSVTEIYNVTNFLANNPEKQSGSHFVKETNVLSPEIQTPPTPQFSPPTYTSKLADFTFVKPKDLEQKEYAMQTTSKATTNTNLSKIPVRRPNLFQNPYIPDSPEAVIPSIRRETFVVNQLNKDNNECLSVSDRRGTYTLQELACELQAKKKDLDRRGTFAIPQLPPQKPDPKPGNPFQSPQGSCTPEDMELTEIIPSGSFASIMNEIQFSDLSLPANKTAVSPKALPSILKVSKSISPIEKFKPSPITSFVTSDHKPGSSKLNKEKVVSKRFEEAFVNESSCLKLTNKSSGKPILPDSLGEVFKHPTVPVSNSDNFGTELPKHLDGSHESVIQTSKKPVPPITPEELLEQQKLSNDHIVPAETDLDECKKSNKASRKSVLPNHPKETLKQQKLSDDSNLEVLKNFKKSNRASRKSVLPNPPKELSKQENQTNDVGYLEEVRECRRSNKTSRKSVLPNLSEEPSKQNNQTNEVGFLEEVRECRISNRTSRKSVVHNPSEEPSKRQNLSSEHGLSDETDSEAINDCKKSNRTLRKSMLPNPKELLNQQNLSDNIDEPDTAHAKTANEVMSLDESTKPSSESKEPELPQEVSKIKPTTKNLKRASSICPKKSVLSRISESSSDSSFSDVIPSESDREVFAPELEKKKIPGRRSLKPGRRKPYIFKKTTKSISKLKLDCGDSKGYDFSSSDEDEESTKKPRRSKKPPKKSTKSLKNKNTVAVLERDIGLKYQEQGRRKRSLKRKVSFANINATPTNSDYEGDAKNSEGEIEISDDMFKTNDEPKKTSAPVRRSILKKPPVPSCSTGKSPISTDISPEFKHKLKKLSSSSSTDKSEQSEEELGYEKNKKSEEIEKQTNGKNHLDGVESRVNVADEKTVSKSKEIEADNPLTGVDMLINTNQQHADKLSVNKKSSLRAREGNSLSKLSSAKPHKNSEFFGFESKRSKSKRTFSGVSERSSKKRVTATDDFLEDVDIALPGENPNNGASVIKSLGNAPKNTHVSLTKAATDDLNASDIALPVENKTSDTDIALPVKNKKGVADIALPVENEKGDADITHSSNVKKREAWVSAVKVEPETPVLASASSKKSSNAKAKKKTKTSSDALTEVKENARKSKPKNVLKENIKDTASTPPPSKARKTSSTGSMKENVVVPDLESGGRSRRNRPTVSFKEPSLNRKMRRN